MLRRPVLRSTTSMRNRAQVAVPVGCSPSCGYGPDFPQWPGELGSEGVTSPRKNRYRSKREVGSLPRVRTPPGETMKKLRFIEEQIAYALRLAEGGTPALDVCRQIGISDATFTRGKRSTLEL